jgi:beta-ribofuranosylaminobenzene 5'-phosphate synthase
MTAELARLVLLGILPSLIEHDLPAFGDSLHEFNRRVGEMFEPWQGGVYANPQSAELIDWLRGQGINGVGQSSWGPTVFAIGEEDRLRRTRTALLRRFSLSEEEVLLTAATNRGATRSSTPECGDNMQQAPIGKAGSGKEGAEPAGALPDLDAQGQ